MEHTQTNDYIDSCSVAGLHFQERFITQDMTLSNFLMSVCMKFVFVCITMKVYTSQILGKVQKTLACTSLN